MNAETLNAALGALAVLILAVLVFTILDDRTKAAEDDDRERFR